MTGWRRVSPVGMLVVFTYVCVVIGSGLLFAILISVLAGTGTVESWAGFIGAVVFLVLWTLAAWRLNRWGLWMSDWGVRYRALLPPSRTMPWSDIAGFDTGPGRLRELMIVLKDGSTVGTNVMFGLPRFGATGISALRSVVDPTTVVPTEDRAERTLRELERGLSRYS